MTANRNPYRIGITQSQTAVNWSDLWDRLRDVYALYGKDRQVAVLNNFRDSKEAICRKLGVVKGMDVVRISKKLKADQIK